MMPRFLSNTQTFMLTFCLIGSICSVCPTSGAKESSSLLSQHEVVEPPGTQLIQHFIQDMQAGKVLYARYGFPFWLDSRWIKDEATLTALLSEGAKQRPFPEISDLHVEIHPLTTLAVKSPQAFERLSLKAEAAFLEKTRLAVVFFEIKKEGQLNKEESWLLVQPVLSAEPVAKTAQPSGEARGAGHVAWQLVGLLER